MQHFKIIETGHVLEYEIEETVYLTTDKEQLPRIVTGFSLRPFNSVSYYLSHGTQETIHYAFEISPTRDELMAL